MRLITKTLLFSSLLLSASMLNAQQERLSMLQQYMHSSLNDSQLELQLKDVNSECWNRVIKVANYAYSGGEGTEASPYLISTSADLVNLSKAVDDGNTYEGKYFKMTGDIDMTKQYMIPIGSNFRVNGHKGLRPFKGVFDGDNHIIKNFTVDYVGQYEIGTGIFGLIQDATIKNIKLEDCIFKADAQSGALCGMGIGCTIINCHVGSTVKVTSKLHSYCAGILVGCFIKKASIIGCSNRASIDNQSVASGGIIANNSADGTTIQQCVNFGKIFSRGDNSGGIIGYAEKGNVSIMDCANYGDVESMSEVSGGIGALVGPACRNITIRNCINSSNLLSSANRAQPILVEPMDVGSKVIVSNNFYNKEAFDSDQILYAEGLTLAEMMTDEFAERLNAGRDNGPWRLDNGYLYPYDNKKVTESINEIVGEDVARVVSHNGKISVMGDDYRIESLYDLSGRMYNHNEVLPSNVYIIKLLNLATNKICIVKITI